MILAFTFGLRVHQNIFKKFPLFGGGAIYDPRNFICTNLLHSEYQCIRAIGLCKEYFSDTPNFPYCSLFLGPKWDQSLDLRTLQNDASYQMWF